MHLAAASACVQGFTSNHLWLAWDTYGRAVRGLDVCLCMCECTPHAAFPPASRITSRTWRCDLYYLSRIAGRFVIKGHSVTKRIRHSEVYRSGFQKNVRMQTYSATTTTYIRSLSSANRRFDSHCTPFCRGVVFFDALVATAQQMQDERRASEEGNDAKVFLEQLDEESALTFAALADAGAEALILTRFSMMKASTKASSLSKSIGSWIESNFFFWRRGACAQGTHSECRETSHDLGPFLLAPAHTQPLRLRARPWKGHEADRRPTESCNEWVPGLRWQSPLYRWSSRSSML